MQARGEWLAQDSQHLVEILNSVGGIQSNTNLMYQMWLDLGSVESNVGGIRTDLGELDETLEIIAANTGEDGPLEVAILDVVDALRRWTDDREWLAVLAEEMEATSAHLDVIEDALTLTSGGGLAADVEELRAGMAIMSSEHTSTLPYIRDTLYAMLDHMDAAASNTGPSAGSGTDAAGGTLAGMASASKPTASGPVPTWTDPTSPAFTADPFEPIEADETEVSTDKLGLNNWTVNYNTAGVFTAMGTSVAAPVMSISTDMSWFDGTIRNTLHAAILAVVGVWSVLFVFEEFRRTA